MGVSVCALHVLLLLHVAGDYKLAFRTHAHVHSHNHSLTHAYTHPHTFTHIHAHGTPVPPLPFPSPRYFIMSGRVDLYLNAPGRIGDTVLQIAKTGEHIGEHSCLGASTQMLDARASAHCHLNALLGADLHTVLQYYHDAKKKLEAEMATWEVQMRECIDSWGFERTEPVPSPSANAPNTSGGRGAKERASSPHGPLGAIPGSPTKAGGKGGAGEGESKYGPDEHLTFEADDSSEDLNVANLSPDAHESSLHESVAESSLMPKGSAKGSAKGAAKGAFRKFVIVDSSTMVPFDELPSNLKLGSTSFYVNCGRAMRGGSFADSRGIEAELKAIQGDNGHSDASSRMNSIAYRKAKKVKMPSRVSGMSGHKRCMKRWDVLRRVQCAVLCCRRVISPLFFVCCHHCSSATP